MSDVKTILAEAEDHMKKALEHLDLELMKIRAGRANATMLDSVKVDYYGTDTPLSQIANISTPDARTLNIQPWEKKMIEPIEKAILASNLGLNPQNNGEVVMINVPMLTEERRKDLSKQAKAEGETAKISLRSIRHKAQDAVKKLEKDGLAEDAAKDGAEQVDKVTSKFGTKIDALVDAKEVDIMKV